MENLERKWSVKSPDHLFSPAFVYNQINNGSDQGGLIPDAMEVIKTHGCATLKTMPYSEADFTTQPTEVAITEAQKFKAKSYSSVNHSNLNELKSILAEKNCIVVGIEVFENFNDYRGGVYRGPSGEDTGGHAILVVGYDDSKNAFKLENSWGTEWGDKGFAWVDYEAFKKICFEAWVMYDDVQGLPDKAPSAPQNVEVSSGAFNDRIRITWDKSTGADSYSVNRSLSSDNKFSEIGTTTGNEYVDTKIKPGEKYLYSIIAIGKAGKSDYSDGMEGYAKDTKKDKLPGNPQKVKTAFSDNIVTISWSPVENAKKYILYRLNHLNTWDKAGQSPDTSIADKAIKVGATYWYSVTAVNDAGESAGSEPVSITIKKSKDVIPAIPAEIAVTKGDFPDKIVVRWSKSKNVATYYLERWRTGLKEWEFVAETEKDTYSDNKVDPGVYYYYAVSARNKIGFSEFTDYQYGYTKGGEEDKDSVSESDITDNTDNVDERYYNEEKDNNGKNQTSKYSEEESGTDNTIGPILTGKIYNTNNGTCEIKSAAMDFYVDGKAIGTVKSGQHVSYKLTKGNHVFKVRNTKTKEVLEKGYTLAITDNGWWFWYGCPDGTHP